MIETQAKERLRTSINKSIGKLKRNQLFKDPIIAKKLLKVVMNDIKVNKDDLSFHILEQ